ncbi:MAG: type III secretion system export apparatus subunit SctT [Desulfovibrio sp.]|nr:type III secretion system export apparatus subunit SctT [Desulfovibrio sp.]
MDLVSFFDELGIFKHLSAFLLGMPRLFAVGLVAPFLGTGVIEGQVWLVMVLGFYLPIHPCVVAQLTPALTLSAHIDLSIAGNFACIYLKETLIGFGLGFLASIPFWAVETAGVFIDNQRGAAQAEGTEILTGKSVSPMGALLFQCLIYLFFTSGAFLTFLALVYASYELWPVSSMLPVPNNFAIPLFFAGKVAWLMAYMMLISAPVAVACLLVDISLGLINRFSPQLNAYVLAMPIKSGMAALLLCFYLGMLLAHAPGIFHHIDDAIHSFQGLLGASHG